MDDLREREAAPARGVLEPRQRRAARLSAFAISNINSY
jgi:hypothetical protein